MISEAKTAGSNDYVVFNYFESPDGGGVDVPTDGKWNTRARERCGIQGESCVEEVIVSGHNRDPLWNLARSLANTDLCTDECHIWLTGCVTAQAGTPQQLANDTGCTVHGSLVSLTAGTWYRNRTQQRKWTWNGIFEWYEWEDIWREFSPGNAAPAAGPGDKTKKAGK